MVNKVKIFGKLLKRKLNKIIKLL